MDYLKFFKLINAQKQLDSIKENYKDKKVVIYGAGIMSEALFENFDLKGLDIIVCDKRFQNENETFFGYPAINPEKLKEIDVDVIFILLLREIEIRNYLEYSFLFDTKNENVPIKLMFKIPFFNYKKHHCFDGEHLKYKYAYKNLIRRYKNLYSKLDACNLKPAKGEMREYQLNTLNFCYEILKIIENLNLTYFPIGGTVIGQVRHKGFIPWDDDFDIGMMRKEFNEFKKYCEKNFIIMDSSKVSFSKSNRHPVLEKYLKKYPNKIIYFLTPHHIQLFCGKTLSDCLNIDIFPHDYYKEDYSIEAHKKYLKQIRKEMLVIDNYKKVSKFLEDEIKNNENIVEKSSKIFYGLDNIDNWLLKKEDWFYEDEIFPLKEGEFENKTIMLQNNPEIFCEKQYANFKQMPQDIELCQHYQARSGKNLIAKHDNHVNDTFKLIVNKLIEKTNRDNYEFCFLLLKRIEDFLRYPSEKVRYKKLYFQYYEKYKFIKSIKN